MNYDELMSFIKGAALQAEMLAQKGVAIALSWTDLAWYSLLLVAVCVLLGVLSGRRTSRTWDVIGFWATLGLCIGITTFVVGLSGYSTAQLWTGW